MVSDSLEAELALAENTVEYRRKNAERYPYPVPPNTVALTLA